MSLRSRLLAAMALVAVVLTVVAVVITATTQNHLVRQVDDRLAVFADRTPPAGPERPTIDARPGDVGPAAGGGDDEGEGETDVDSRPPFAPPSPERFSDLYQGELRDGTLVDDFYPTGFGNHPALAADAGAGLSEGERRFLTVGSDDGTDFRVLLTGADDSVGVRALPLDDVHETVRRLVLLQVAGTGGVVALLALVSWWVLRLGIRPIKAMTAAATRIGAGDLAERVPETTPGTESGELASALNAMLGQIEGALAEREASETRLRRFVADASHELRTPLTTIRGYAELYRHGGLGHRDDLADAMRRTEQEAGRMGRLVDDMLNLAKFDDGRPLRVEPFDLAVVVAEVVDDLRLAAPDRTLMVRTEPAPMRGDADHLRQAVLNVVTNALVHTDAPAAVSVVVTGADRAGDITLTVADTGPGVPDEVRTKLTERFFRADPSRSRQRGGSGLGLAIVAEIIAAHDGTLAVDSELGAGTTVRITVPAAGPRVDGGRDLAVTPFT